MSFEHGGEWSDIGALVVAGGICVYDAKCRSSVAGEGGVKYS